MKIQLKKVSMRNTEWDGGWFCVKCEKLKSSQNKGFHAVGTYNTYCAECAYKMIEKGFAELIDNDKSL